jgi:hypothetical protein
MALFFNTTKFGFVFIYKKIPTKDYEWKTFQAEVGFWENFNHLWDYKVYGIVIKDFISGFLDNLL